MKKAEFLDSSFKKSQDIVYRKIAGESILIPIRKNVADMENIYTLNEVASRIWELIDGRKTAGDIKKIIISEFEIAEGQAQQDILDFLRQLEEIEGIKEA